MWRKQVLLLATYWVGIACANEQLYQQLLQDCINQTCGKEFGYESRTWIFNNWVYAENASGQWISVGYKLPGNFDAWLKDLAVRGVCPKEHRGVYLDKTTYDCGIWYCRGIMHTGQRCPYHMDEQFPRGVPKA